jgi:hypothetical protein
MMRTVGNVLPTVIMILQLMAVTASGTTRQIDLICVSQLPGTENSTSVQIGCLRAACRLAATVHDGSRSAAGAGRSRHGEHPGTRVSVVETLIGGHASNRSSPRVTALTDE